jgi:hypothetical protein
MDSQNVCVVPLEIHVLYGMANMVNGCIICYASV